MADGYTVIDYSDNAEQVAEASASAASATSLYMDQVAKWLLLLPEKLKHLFTTLKAMPKDDVVMWIVAIATLVVLLDFLVNRKRHMGNVRSVWLTPGGIIIGGIWYVFFSGLSAVVYK